MEDRVSLFEEIKSGGYEASIITTFNAYLPFYEEVVLRRLRNSGIRHNVLLMDALQCQRSFSSHPPSKAGRSYALLPMHVEGAFHPKIILLLGKKKGLLSIGSHNLTLSGFGTNRELTNVFRFGTKGSTSVAKIFRQVLDYIENWLDGQGDRLPSHSKDIFEKIKDVSPWLNENSSDLKDIAVIASASDKPSLWQQLTSIVNHPVHNVLVGGAFFDSQLSFLDRLQKHYEKADIIVGIDPDTVKAPPELSTLNKVRVVSSSEIGFSGKDSEQPKGYLHAKFLVIETQNQKTYIITGSANPSAPAWLSSGSSGNTEIMVVRSDSESTLVAETLGLTRLKEESALLDGDWDVILENWVKTDEENSDAIPLGMAVMNERCIRFSTRTVIEAPFECVLLDENNTTIQNCSFANNQQHFEIFLENHQSLIASTIEVHTKESCIERFFIHNEILLEELSRTGEQRKLRDALSSLSFESPDLETFLNCVDRIIFTKANNINREKNGYKADSSPDEINKEQTDFLIDVSETKRAKIKHRLQAKEDLSYLLDILIYHLRIEDNDSNRFDSVDAMGRNEEEQVGEDDSSVISEGKISNDEKNNLLNLCHKKVRLLVSRMVGNLKSFKKKELSFEYLIVRLTGVLAVLRELRNCDGKQDWVLEGKTTVPKECREKLLNSILEVLYEGNQSLFHINQHDPEVAETEDVTALKGLLVWLAWDCGLQFITNKPMAESMNEANERLLHNAYLLAIAQLIDKEDVINEAKKSVALLADGDCEWIDWIARFSQNINELKANTQAIASRNVLPGDVVVSVKAPHAPARLVQSVPDGNKAQMFCFDPERLEMQFMVDSIRCIYLDDVML
ncbi:phospholipase D-like domain-containing protein [Vibrio parahaemolyticus]|uniref:hypothetical protein n=3 Tax=Vibrio parahaemolyticus TaxID=670 RepID=UPI001E43E411|nr:hypothetical protein [Vibrio parahaemolyticus]